VRGAERLRAWCEGFSLRAGVVIAEHDRDALERLCSARPAFAQERLSWTNDGRVAYKLNRPWPDGRISFARSVVGSSAAASSSASSSILASFRAGTAWRPCGARTVRPRPPPEGAPNRAGYEQQARISRYGVRGDLRVGRGPRVHIRLDRAVAWAAAKCDEALERDLRRGDIDAWPEIWFEL
jgi:hypothetical protein